MIEVIDQNNQTQIILMPNRSMSWATNKKILLAIFLLNASIAIGWTFMGAWMVLPFAGIEVLLVGLGMYYVSWKLSFKEVITVHNESFVLQKGVYFPKQEWQWQLSQIKLIKVPNQYRMSAPSLKFQHLNQTIEVGEFLNRQEKKQLREHIIRLNIPMLTMHPKK